MHKQATYKTATPLKLHALKTCFLGNLHIKLYREKYRLAMEGGI